MASTRELILYREFENGKLFYGFTELMEHCADAPADREQMAARYYQYLHDLMELSVSHGFEGNLWHCFLTFLLVNNENAYSRACEIRGRAKGTIAEVARRDFEIFKNLFAFNFQELELSLGVSGADLVMHFQGANDSGKMFNRRIRDRILALGVRLAEADTAEAFQQSVTEFYRDFGVGKLGLHKAFRIESADGGAKIVPITNIAHVRLDDLVGYEIAKKKLTDNTEAFVNGRAANNCLLFGDAGTGKSSSIKAIANQYYDRGLRLIEIYKHQFRDLNNVIGQIKDRGYKFIIYMDDLSFEDI